MIRLVVAPTWERAMEAMHERSDIPLPVTRVKWVSRRGDLSSLYGLELSEDEVLWAQGSESLPDAEEIATVINSRIRA